MTLKGRNAVGQVSVSHPGNQILNQKKQRIRLGGATKWHTTKISEERVAHADDLLHNLYYDVDHFCPSFTLFLKLRIYYCRTWSSTKLPGHQSDKHSIVRWNFMRSCGRKPWDRRRRTVNESSSRGLMAKDCDVTTILSCEWNVRLESRARKSSCNLCQKVRMTSG